MPILSAGHNPRIPRLPDYCNVSAPAVLLKLERSRLLAAWWSGLHGLVGAAALTVSPWLAAAILPPLLLHARFRRPQTTPLILLAGHRISLPAEGRFGLALAAPARLGSWCIELKLADRPASRLVIARDQLDPAAWRVLVLALTKST